MQPEAHPIVVDANVLFASLLRDGTTRRILLHGRLDVRSPAHLWGEFARNRDWLLLRSGLPAPLLDALLESLRARIGSIPLAVMRPHLPEAERRLGKRHALDAPYVAAAIAIDGWLWSHDARIARTAGIRVLGTADVLDLVGLD